MSATSFSSLPDASERRDSYTMSLRIHDIFAYLYNKVDGQTWYIQDILNRLYQNGKEITTAEIDDVTLELVNEQEVAFVNYYDSLTDNQAALLSAIAQDKAHCKKIRNR